MQVPPVTTAVSANVALHVRSDCFGSLRSSSTLLFAWQKAPSSLSQSPCTPLKSQEASGSRSSCIASATAAAQTSWTVLSPTKVMRHLPVCKWPNSIASPFPGSAVCDPHPYDAYTPRPGVDVPEPRNAPGSWRR